MLSAKERMSIKKIHMPQRDAKERINDFNEVPIGYTLEQAITEASRCLNCKNSPCVDGCPVSINIPGFIKKVEENDIKGAVDVLMDKNQLPAICGRVCPQEKQCEANCVVGKKGESVSIGNLERFVADYSRKHNLISLPKVESKKNIKVAVIGSGPGGLTGSVELQKLGYEVTVFEALHKAGGVLFYGIPRFRLPGDVIDFEINGLKKLGVKIETNILIGRTFTIDQLFQEGFKAVLVTTGAGLPTMLNIQGENLKGVLSANEFLTRVNLMRADKFPDYSTPVKIGKKVVVIGAGNTAMDACRTALRFKPEFVKMVYRRSRDEAPARIEELKHAEEEGVDFNFLTAPVRFIGDENYNVKQLEVMKMELGEPDSSGRRRPVPVEGSNYFIETDMVVSALGFGVNPLIVSTTAGISTSKWGTILVDENGMTSKEGVFAAGDIITGGSTVIMAMGQAKKAAVGIHKYLSN